jgi:hypothetical protein
MCFMCSYTTWPKVCWHLLIEHLIPKSLALIWSWSSFAAITASTLLGSISTRCWNIAAGTYFHSATRALVRSDTDVGRLGLARSRRSNSPWRWSMGLRSGLFAGQSSSFTPLLTNHFRMHLALCTGHCHDKTGKGLPQTVATKLEVQNRPECLCHCFSVKIFLHWD